LDNPSFELDIRVHRRVRSAEREAGQRLVQILNALREIAREAKQMNAAIAARTTKPVY
jgi:hypothetical protein